MTKTKQPEVVQAQQPRTFLWRHITRRETALAFHLLSADRAVRDRNSGNIKYARHEARDSRKFYQQWKKMVETEKEM